MVNITAILDPSLGVWELDVNEHLFEWSAELVTGDPKPIGGDRSPVVFKEKSFSDVRYGHQGHDRGLAINRNHKDKKTSNTSAPSLRRKLKWGEVEAPKPGDRWSTNPQGYDPSSPLEDTPSLIARPLATVYKGSLIANPYVGKFESFTVPTDDEPEIEPNAYNDGVEWAIAAIFKPVLGFTIPSTLIPILKVSGCAQVFALHAAKKPKEEIETLVEQFKLGELLRLRRAVAHKVERCAAEYHRWADKGRLPIVINDDIDEALTLANMATALVGMSAVWAIARECYSFKEGVEGAIDEFDTWLTNEGNVPTGRSLISPSA